MAWIVTTLMLFGACTRDQTESQGTEKETLGAVNFPTSCNEDVAETFARGIALLHSFEYPEARADFQAVAEQDPACGIAHWGVAMTYLHPVWPSPMTAERFTAGNIAAEKAETVGAPTDRERAYIETTRAFYGHGVERPHRVRAQAWSDAVHGLSEHFPDDTEAAIFYALSLLGTSDPTDATLGNQKQAAALLNELLPSQRNHPGIAHYLIHSLDYPALADQGLPAALVYAQIAPSSSHALHMPSHIFTRLGMWDESIATNIKSRDAARQLSAKTTPGVVSDAELHAQAYLAYAYLQIDDQALAKAVVDEVAQVTRGRSGDPLAAIPARWALERRDWEAAAKIEFSAVSIDMKTDWPRLEVRAITPFARALGAARTGQIEEARVEVEKLRLLQRGLVESPIPGPYDWTSQVESMWLAAAAWVAFAEERTEEAVDLARSAAKLAEAAGKHPRTPGALLPPRELLGDLLMELNRPAEALVEYERSLREAPRRFNSLYGAARAAELSGSPEKAKEYYGKLVEMTVDESTRPEVEQARAFLASV
jgi:tetratricopeptide (TPR) repeat protein